MHELLVSTDFREAHGGSGTGVLRFVCDSVCSVCHSPVRRAVRKRRSGVRRVARGRGGPLPPEPDPDYNFTPTILTIA